MHKARWLAAMAGLVAGICSVAACGSGGSQSGFSPVTLRPTATTTAVSPATPSSAPTTAPDLGQRLPLGYSTANATQVVTVVAPSARSTTATVQAWTKTSGGWTRHGPAIRGHVGSQGVSPHASETRSVTPAGSYTITQAFGSAQNPVVRLPYFQTNSSDWWDGDSHSPTYNTHQRCEPAACAFHTTESENLYYSGYVYKYAMVIDYNTRNSATGVVPGGGSAFFFHVSDGQPTAGCVSIPERQLVAIMRWINPADHPRILIGVR